MLNAQAEFDQRHIELIEYINYVDALENSTGSSVTLMNTMKSSALLMMYNIIESTMTNLLQDIFDHLESNHIAFDGLNDNMKALVLSYSKKRNPAKLVEKMNSTSLNLVVACFEKSDVFSGNLDCQKIRETLREIGIRTQHQYREPALLTVKTERNDLAHGTKSFSECGRTYSTTQIRQLYAKTKTILDRVISDTEAFLTSGAYA